jgi:hypothetical protein
MKNPIFQLCVVVFSASMLYACVNGKGEIITQTVGVSNFTKIEHGTKGRMTLVKDNNQFLVFTGHQNLFDILKIEVSSGVLKIRTKAGKSIGKFEELHFEVHTPYVEEIKVSGPGSVLSEENITGNRFTGVVSSNGELEVNQLDTDFTEAVISGSGSLTLRGKTKKAELGVGSAGQLYAFECVAKENLVELRGNGIIETTTTDKLNVRLIGNGGIYYKGNPEINMIVNSGQGVLVNAN